MTRLIRGVIALAVCSAILPAPAGAQVGAERPQASFRSSLDLVSIQTSVRDRRGRPVKGLTTDDFEVRDNGKPTPILSFRSDRQSPLSLAVLVDMSGSMRVGPKMAMTRQVFDTLLKQLRPGHDELALLTFDSALHERQPFTKEIDRLSGVLDNLKPFGSTSLYDAIAATARRLGARSATHKAIIVLTDGTDTSSTLTAPEVSGLASSIDVPVYIVATVPSIDQAAMLETEDPAGSRPSGGAALKDLAEWTGGSLLFAASFGETVAVAARLLEELRQQYVLAIEAAQGLNEWRRLEVRVRDRSAVVKARSGYFGG